MNCARTTPTSWMTNSACRNTATWSNHAKLFSGSYKDLPGFTPDRRWLISEFIFDAKFNKLLDYNAQRDIDGKRQMVIGDNNRNGVRVNLTNPFLLPNHSGVRYYDTTIARWRASADDAHQCQGDVGVSDDACQKKKPIFPRSRRSWDRNGSMKRSSPSARAI